MPGNMFMDSQLKCTGKIRNCVFLPYNQNGKIRAETYDPYLFQYYLNQKEMIRLSLLTVTFKTFSYEH
jgi:hypothetical protein